jgi:membrane-bound ClpP family serine protease
MLLDIIIIVFLMVTAIVLVLLEIFLLPGITIAGIGGALFAMGGVVYAYTVDTTIGHITLISSIVAFGIAFVWLLRSKSFSKVALNTDIDSKLTSSRDLGIQPGDKGISLSRLAPIGKARFNDIVVEAKSISDFIDENTPIVVLRVDGYNVVVTTINEITQINDNTHI